MRHFAFVFSVWLVSCTQSQHKPPTRNTLVSAPKISPCRRTPPVVLSDVGVPPAELVAFERFLQEYKTARSEERSRLAGAFLEQQRGFPLVASDGTVVFFYLGTGEEKEIQLVGDFKPRGFRDVYWSPVGIPMSRAVANEAVFFVRLQLEPDARLDYQFVVDGKPQLDPLNERSLTSGTALSDVASELVMPGYIAPTLAKERPEVDKGTLQIVTEAWATHLITIYLPPHYDASKKYPVVYTADGSAWLNIINLPTIIDNLIAEKSITPVIAVMVNPDEDRGGWYFYNPDYLAYLEKVVAYVDSKYSTQANASGRLHVGTSAGGRASLYVGLESPTLFSNIALLSPSLGNAVYYVEPYLNGTKKPKPDLRVWLSAGTYEGSLCEDTQSLERYFNREELENRVVYTHEGHSFGNWQNHTEEVLRFFFSEKK